MNRRYCCQFCMLMMVPGGIGPALPPEVVCAVLAETCAIAERGNSPSTRSNIDPIRAIISVLSRNRRDATCEYVRALGWHPSAQSVQPSNVINRMVNRKREGLELLL